MVGGTRFDWLRPANAADLAAATADRLACFPLLPFSNRIRDGMFAFGGRTVRLPPNRASGRHAIHGHGWQAAWRIAQRQTDRVLLEYEHRADAWPWPYLARQEVALAASALTLTLAVENRSDAPMPLGLGWHPYFARTPSARVRARVEAMWATDSQIMPTDLVVPDARLATDAGLPVAAVALDNVFTGWRHEAVIAWPERNAELAIAAETPMDFLVVYAPPVADFFCIEPVSHCTDAFNLAARGRPDTGMLVLAPGATARASMVLRPALRGATR